MENIIKKAIEGGYANDRPEYARQHLITGFEGDFRFMVIDPLFWQSLGKECGWKEKYKHRIKDEDRPALKCSDCDKKPMVGDGNCYGNISNEWEKYALRFHEINLTESWDKAVEYLNRLIK